MTRAGGMGLKGGPYLRKHLRLQSAMEYLMTYGWAILIIAIVLSALFQLGVFNSANFVPRVPPGSCRVFRSPAGGSPNLEGVCSGQLPQFVGSFSSTGHITVANSLSLNVQTATFSLWVDTSTIGWNDFIDKDTYGSNGFAVDTASDGTPYLYLYNSGTIRSQHPGFPVLADGKWHHFVITYDGTFVNYYIDGNNVYSYNYGSYLAIGTSSQVLTLGRVSDTWAGTMANVQVYNISLDATSIRSLYFKGIGGAPISPQYLVGWWPLNGDTNDYSGNNNNGVPTGISYVNQWLNGYTPP